MKNITILTVVVGLQILFTGCSRPQQVISSDPVCLPQIDVSRAMQAARTVLEEMQFSVEKYDPEARYIRTRPLSAAQFFQVWRQDNASPYTSAQANLQSLRRIVEVEATPYANRTCLECRVYVQQLSLLEEPIVGAWGTAGSYTSSSSTYQTLRVESEQLEKMEWLDKGLDRALEQKILSKIRGKAAL
ncbi:MAG: hypothetical protein ISS71_08040 [Phycisphaerae bacterium]|nr:hypothetical protein [Phycisphaerae bacterium]